jgi:tRNA modification GTPase
VEAWQQRLLGLAAELEAMIDFSDEGEVGEALPKGWTDRLSELRRHLKAALARPSAERLREGVRLVIAGPPNTGKSSLLNWLAGREAAITSALAGTTRDIVEAPTALGGTPFLLIDTAGLRVSNDEIEALGIERARRNLAAADLILWLGAPNQCPDKDRSIVVQSKIDVLEPDPAAEAHVSAETGEGMAELVETIVTRSRTLLPQAGEATLNQRHRHALNLASEALEEAADGYDHLIVAEALRQARHALDQITGRAGVEDMLDALFGRFCIGK